MYASELIYNKPISYNDILFYPVKMEHVLRLQTLQQSFIVRKNSVFRDKKIIKMSYLQFLIFAAGNTELEEEYDIKYLSCFFFMALELIALCCPESSVTYSQYSGQIYIDGKEITPEIFDNIRRIIILQNDIDFDIDEFINYDTELILRQAQNKTKKDDEAPDIEDYIDSLVIAMHTTEDRVMNMTVRKFWRYLKRYNLYEDYQICKTGECSGMVTFKEPIKHWMRSLEVEDKYKHLKADEGELRSKIG